MGGWMLAVRQMTDARRGRLGVATCQGPQHAGRLVAGVRSLEDLACVAGRVSALSFLQGMTRREGPPWMVLATMMAMSVAADGQAGQAVRPGMTASAEQVAAVACPDVWQPPLGRVEPPSGWLAVSDPAPAMAGPARVTPGARATGADAPGHALRWPVRSSEALAWRDHHHLASTVRPGVFWRQQWQVPPTQEARLVCAYQGLAQTLSLPLPKSAAGWRCQQFAGKSSMDDGDWMWMPAVCEPMKGDEGQAVPASVRTAAPTPAQRQAVMAQNSRMAEPPPAQAPVRPGRDCPARLVLAEADGPGRRELPLSGMGLLSWTVKDAGASSAAQQVEMLFPDQMSGQDGPPPRISQWGWTLTPQQGLVWMRCEYQGAAVALQRPVMAKGTSLADDACRDMLQGRVPDEAHECELRVSVSRVPLPPAVPPAKRSAQAGRDVPWAPAARFRRQVLEAGCRP